MLSTFLLQQMKLVMAQDIAVFTELTFQVTYVTAGTQLL